MKARKCSLAEALRKGVSKKEIEATKAAEALQVMTSPLSSKR